MARVGYLDDHCVDHRQVQAGGHPVVQEAGVFHLPLVVKVVFFVQGPTDALDHAALHLAFHVAGVDGLAGVLDGGVVEDGHLARLGVRLHVDDVGAESAARALGVHTDLAGNGAAGAV